MNKNFRKTKAFKILRKLKHGIYNWFYEATGKRPKIHIQSSMLTFRTLGTDYGGWTFSDTPNLFGTTIISCGAGEDISFDLQFAAKYGAKVIIVDPTPRAAAHVKKIIERIEEAASTGALGTLEIYGIQDFSGIDTENLKFVEKAVWNEKGTLRLFPPKNPAHVSHSALDFQNNYEQKGDFIEVEALSYRDLITDLCLTEVPILKLDIEGAEIEVLTSLSHGDILPEQICVEYDELLRPSKIAADRVRKTHNHLVDLGYEAVFKDTLGVNFLYTRSALARLKRPKIGSCVS